LRLGRHRLDFAFSLISFIPLSFFPRFFLLIELRCHKPLTTPLVLSVAIPGQFLFFFAVFFSSSGLSTFFSSPCCAGQSQCTIFLKLCLPSISSAVSFFSLPLPPSTWFVIRAFKGGSCLFKTLFFLWGVLLFCLCLCLSPLVEFLSPASPFLFPLTPCPWCL